VDGQQEYSGYSSSDIGIHECSCFGRGSDDGESDAANHPECQCQKTDVEEHGWCPVAPPGDPCTGTKNDDSKYRVEYHVSEIPD
jgi:hypothetical protein